MSEPISQGTQEGRVASWIWTLPVGPDSTPLITLDRYHQGVGKIRRQVPAGLTPWKIWRKEGRPHMGGEGCREIASPPEHAET